MSNHDVNPAYKGRYLKNIVADFSLVSLKIASGTVLVHDTGNDSRVFFQLKEDYDYKNENSSVWYCRSRNNLMGIMEGSCIGFTVKAGSSFAVAQCVRFPTDDELEWYENQDTV